MQGLGTCPPYPTLWTAAAQARDGHPELDFRPLQRPLLRGEAPSFVPKEEI